MKTQELQIKNWKREWKWYFFNKYFEEYQQGFAANGELLKVIENNDMILNLFRRELDRLR